MRVNGSRESIVALKSKPLRLMWASDFINIIKKCVLCFHLLFTFDDDDLMGGLCLIIACEMYKMRFQLRLDEIYGVFD